MADAKDETKPAVDHISLKVKGQVRVGARASAAHERRSGASANCSGASARAARAARGGGWVRVGMGGGAARGRGAS